jgi:hypothetical protein
MTKQKCEATLDLSPKAQVRRGQRHNFEKRVEIPVHDIKQAYVTWEWQRLLDLSNKINAKYGKTISVQYLSLLAKKHGWNEVRRAIKAGISGDLPRASLSDLAREGRNFNLEKSLRGLQSRLLQVIAAHLTTRDPEYLRGMIQVYEHFENLITKARQSSESRKVFIAPFSRRQE